MHAIQDITLSNGLHFLAQRVDGVRSVGLSWLLPAGHAIDRDDALGRAAMWSELLLRGAADLDSRAQADAFDKLGASRSVDPGAVFMKIGSTMLGSAVSDTLPRLVEMIREPSFADDSVEPVRDLCLQALDSLADEPQQRAVFEARARHFAPPFDRTGMGTADGLNALSRDVLLNDWRAHAVPGGAILAVVGDLDPEAIAEQLESLLSDWVGSVELPKPGGAGERGRAHMEDDSAQVQVIVVNDAPADPDPDSVLEKIVISALSGGMSGRLFTEVREKRGLCYAVSASYRADKHHGSVTSYVGTTPERAEESVEVLLAELERINQGIDAEEFERAVTGMKSRLVFAGESTSARAATLAMDAYRRGTPRTLDQIAAEVDRVTLDDVNAYLARRDLGTLTIQTLGPTPSSGSAPAADPRGD